MNVADRTAVLEGSVLHEEMAGVVDERTLEILERRRRTAVVRRRGWLVRRMLLLADVLGLAFAFFIAQLLVWSESSIPADRIDVRTEYLIFAATLPLWVVVAKLYGLYDHDEERTDHTTMDDFAGVFHLVTVGAWLLFAGASLTNLADPTLDKLLIFWAVAIALVVLARASARSFCRRRITYLQNTVIVGAGDVGQLVARKLLKHPEYGINLVGFIDSQPKERRADLEYLTLLGSLDQLPAIMRTFDIERVIIAFSNESHERLIELVRSLKDMHVQIDIVPRLYEIVGSGVGIHTVEGLPLVGLPHFHLSRSSLGLKRALDLVISSLMLVVLAPAFLAIAVLIKLDSPGPVFFRQLRMGRRDRTFRIYKFRTMALDADERKDEFADLNMHTKRGGDPRMFKIPDDPRMTRVGRVLRRLSLDEFPQLINVFKGEMSLVGPRPLILDEDQYVGDWARKRLDLKPGMTGLWQTLGRNSIPFEEMIALDYQYVVTWSLWNDVRLLVSTLPVLFCRTSAGY